MESFRRFLIGFVVGAVLVGGIVVYNNLKDADSRIPGVTESDIQQLPPNSKNVKSLGNRWLSFDMEGEDRKVRTFWFRRGWRTDQPDIMIQVQ